MDTNYNNDESEKNNEESEVTEVTIKKKYDHSKKLELVNKIYKIKKKEYLLNIFKILLSNSVEFTENNNGVYLLFHNLSDETYDKIDNYINMLYKNHRKNSHLKANLLSSDISDSIMMSDSCTDFMSDTIELNSIGGNINTINKNLSNKEKLIMKRKKYEQYLNQNQE